MTRNWRSIVLRLRIGFSENRGMAGFNPGHKLLGPILYFVPNIRSPASPRPGTI